MSPNKINGVVLHRLLRLRLVMFAVVGLSAIDVIDIVHSKQNTSIMEMCMLQSIIQSPRCGEKARLIKILARGDTNEAEVSHQDG